MADRVLKECKEGEWTLVAENVVTGWLRLPLTEGAFNFTWTSRDYVSSEVTPPSNLDKTDEGCALPLFEEGRNEEISSVNAQNFYIWVENADTDSEDTAKLRVDL